MSPDRPSRIALIAIGSLALLLWLGVLLALFYERQGRAEPPPIDPALSGRAGINLDRGEASPARIGQALDAVGSLGLDWVRFTLPWDEVEPVAGRFDWADWDAVAEAFRARPELEPLVVLGGTPPWARRLGEKDNPAAPPQQRSDFGAFAYAVAARYGDLFDWYQIWHEPNIAPHWGSSGVDASDYTGLLREGAIAVRSADPGAKVVLAALAPTTESSSANLDDAAYLEAIYDAGGAEWFDLAAGEPFGFSEPPGVRAEDGKLNFARLARLRRVMERHGDAATSMIAASFGWNALPDGWTGPPSPWGQVSELQQAEYLSRAFEIARGEWTWLGPLFWAAGCPARADDPWLGFALCGTGGQQRPAGRALAAVGEPAVLGPGAYRPSHPVIAYDPGWRVTSEAADPGATGDTAEFVFEGTGVALKVARGPYWGYLTAWVDGTPAEALPRSEEGTAELVLYDPDAREESVILADGLEPGRHHVRLTATGGWGQWPLRGVVVVAGRSSPSHLPELLGLSAAAATVLFAWFWVGRRRASDLAPAAPVGPAGFLPGGAPLRATARPHGTAWTEVALYLLPFLLVALLFISHSAILDLAAVAALGLVFLVRPELALPIAAASVASWQRPETILRWQFSLLEMTTWLGALALAARLLLDRAGLLAYTRWQGAKGIRGLDWPVLALLGSGLMAALFARFQDYAWGEFRTVFLAGTLLYWLASRAGWSDRRHWPVLHGLVAGLTAASAIALWQLASGEGRIAVEGVWRVSALYGSPNDLALVLDRGVPLAVAIAAFGLGRKRWVYAAAALIMVAAALATLSKGALLVGLPVGLATTLGIGAWRARVRWPWFALAAMLSGAILGWLALRNTPRFGGLLDTTTGTTFLRLKLWRGAVNMALDHPLLGVGPDNFLYQYRSRYVQPSAWQELNLSHPHNIILDLWTRLGIPGLLAGAWAFGAAGITGWRITKAAARDVWPPALGLLAGLAGTVAHGLIDNAIFLPDLMAIFMITLALYRRWQVGILTEETA